VQEVSKRIEPTRRVTLLPPGFCLRCGHHEDAHVLDLDFEGTRRCETEVRDYGEMDCSCPGLRLCAACEGDPEAHDLHVCGRTL
jgi:hypothetical protein